MDPDSLVGAKSSESAAPSVSSDGNSKRKRRRRAREEDSSEEAVLCLYCGEKGHSEEQCPSNPMQS